MNVNLTPKTVFVGLLILISLLIVANIMALALEVYFDKRMLRILQLGEEQNIPTLYASITLFLTGILLALIAIEHRGLSDPYIAWAILALLFMFLSLDEFAMLHERLIIPVRNILGTSSYFSFAWIIPYGIGLFVFVAAYAKFLLRLPRRTMTLFILAGFTFVLGAIGIEMIEGMVHETYGFTHIFQLLQTVEESLEMIGVAMFIFALLEYMVIQFGSLNITVK